MVLLVYYKTIMEVIPIKVSFLYKLVDKYLLCSVDWQMLNITELDQFHSISF